MSSIPLPALHAATYQAPDVMDQYSKILQIKQLLGQGQMQQQALQGAQLENQSRQMQIQQQQRTMQDQQTIMDAQKQFNGDPRQWIPALRGKILPQTFQSILQGDAETRKKLADADASERAALQAKNQQFIGLMEQAKNLPDPQYAQAWPQILQQAEAIHPGTAQQYGLDPNQPIPKDQLAKFEVGLMTADQYFKQADEEAKAKKRPFEQQKAESDAATAQAEAKIKGEEAALSPAERMIRNQSALEYFAAKGDPLANAALQKKIQVAKASRPTVVTNENLLTPDAIDMAASYYRQTGTLPSGFSRSPQTTAAVIQRAAQQAKELGGNASDIAQNKVDYKSFSAMDRDFKAGKAANNIRALNTAIGHLNHLYDAADALNSGNVKVLNQIANSFNLNVQGKSAPAVFDAIKTAATGELGSTFKGAAATDPEIANLSATLSKDLSKNVNKDVIRTDAQLLGSRLYALHEQYTQGNNGQPPKFRILYPNSENSLKRMGVPMDEFKAATSQQKESNASTGGPQVGEVRQHNGHNYKFDGNQWVIQ